MDIDWLKRDLEREERNKFAQEGFGIHNLLQKPEYYIRTLGEMLDTYVATNIYDGLEKRRDRWQYSIGICLQILKHRKNR